MPFRIATAVFGIVSIAMAIAGCGQGAPVAEIRPTVAASSVLPAGGERPARPADADWPCWRGTSGTGVAVGSAPVEWSPTKNVVWSAIVPGKGHSSPTVWGEQVFLATADEAKETMSLLAFDRSDGGLRWTCLLHEGGFMHVHAKNTQASATAACDGKHVYWTAMVKNAIWLSAVTLDGRIAWQTEVGPFVSMHGYGSSPTIHQDLVFVQGDSKGPGWLAAVYKETGKIHWRAQRGNGASFATPVVGEVAGRLQLLLHGQDKVVSYNPASGEKLWECDGPATYCANTPCTNGDLVFVSGGFPQTNTWAIKADGSGQVVWRENWKCYVPSMLVDGELLFVPQDNGVVRCVKSATGKELWTKRVGGDLTSSPVIADGKLYVTTEAGKTIVLKAGRELEEVAENDNGDRCYATPTICGARIYLRTCSKISCIGDSEAHEVSAN